MINVSIIIPAWKEARRIGRSLEELGRFLTDHELGLVEVLVVVVDSPDRTLEIVQSKSDLFKNYKIIEAWPRAGKGRDVRLAMQEAKGEYKLFMDADLATPLHHLKSVHRLMSQNKDVIIGVRDLHASHKGLRKMISMAGNLLIRVVLGLNIRDTQCGFKAFRGPVANDLFEVQTINGWGFDMELLAIAKKRGYSIQTIHIYDWQDVEGGTFNNVAIRGALSTIKDLLIIKWNLLSRKYEHINEQVPVLRES